METQITELFGLQIYTDKGMFVGEVEDVLIDVDQKKIDSIVVSKVNDQLFELKNFKGLKIPYRIISAIDDIVLIRHLPGPSPAAVWKSKKGIRLLRENHSYFLCSRMVVVWKTGKYFQQSLQFPLFLSGLTGVHFTGLQRTLP